MKDFVIVVDTQRDFMAADGALSVAGADALIAPMRAWLAARDPARTAGVLFTFDTHEPEVYAASPEAEAFPLHCVRGSEGWANVLDPATLDPTIPAYGLEKGVFDMWAESGLTIEDLRDPAAPPVLRDLFFDRLRGAPVTVIGVAADYCVRWALTGLVERGFEVAVPADLTRGITRAIDTVIAEDFAGAAIRLTPAR